MKKLISSGFARKLIVGGGLLIALSIIIALTSLFSAYSKIGENLNNGSGFSLETDQLLANIAMFSRWVGIIFLLVGIALYCVTRSRSK